MTRECGAERFLTSCGPAEVPLWACCAAAILHAAAGVHDTAPFICAETQHHPQQTVEPATMPAGGRP